MIENRRRMHLARWLRRVACRIDMHRNVDAYGFCRSCDEYVGQH